MLLVPSVRRIQGYSRESIGLTAASLTSAWLFIIIVASRMAIMLPSRIICLSEGLPFCVAALGFSISALIELLLVAFPEEVFFRGMLQDRFIALTSSSKNGIMLTAFLFAAFHIPKHVLFEQVSLWNLLRAIPLVIAVYAPLGIALGIVFYRTRSLKWSIAIHTIVNLALIDPLGFYIAALLL